MWGSESPGGGMPAAIHPDITSYSGEATGKRRPPPCATVRVGLSRIRLRAGSSPVWADQEAYATLFGLVQRDPTMIALIRVFQFLGVLVLALIPLIALTKRPPKGQPSQPMAH